MVLNPLTEIIIGMFMAVGIGSGQFMMDFLRNGKRRKHQQDTHQANREASFQDITYFHSAHSITHYHTAKNTVKYPVQ